MKSHFNTKTIVWSAIILTGLAFLITILTSEMAYLTNDDGGIQSVLSGAITGEPYPYHQFISVILSFPIAGLYRIFPNIQWWYVWSLLAMAIGIFLVHYCLLWIAYNGNHSVLTVYGIIIFLDVGFFIYPIANISFTIVPAVLGTGIVASLFWLAEKDSIKHKVLMYIGIVIGYVLLFAHRRQTGLALLCYILLAFLYYYVNRSENLRKAVIKFTVTAAGFLLLTVSLTEINTIIQNNHNGEDFVAFNSARSQFMDYPHDTYEENPELYEKVGWDEDTYNLATKWCFLNENVNTEKLSYISDNSIYTNSSINVNALIDEIYHDKQCRAIFILYAASVILAGFFMVIQFNKKILLFLLMNNIGTGVLILYQIINGRALYRSIVVVLLPAFVINLMLSLQQEVQRKSSATLKIVLLFLGLICVIPMLSATFDVDRKDSVATEKEKHNVISTYVAEHPSDFYVREVLVQYENIDPVYLTQKVSNCMGWGSSSKYSTIYYEQLKANGLSELTEQTFTKDNVYFISQTNVLDESYYDSGMDTFAMLYRKLQEDCDAIGFIQEDKIEDDAYVYHFIFEENVQDYDYYYDIRSGYTIQVTY